MHAIQTKKITKKFGRLKAVDDVSLQVEEGEVFGLLGPNGAGKTTFISMLVTLKKPDSGTGTVNEFDIVNNPSDVRKSIGIVFQDSSVDDELTAYENLDIHAAMYGVPQNERKKRIKEVIKLVELSDRINDVVKTFSGGMRRRLEIARGLLHYPKVLFLDEPTLGLDPQTRKHIWEYIEKMKKEHKITVVLTTHYMDEADLLCDRIAIIDHGKIIALDTGEKLKDMLGGDVITVASEKSSKLKNKLKRFKWVKEVKEHNGKLTIRVDVGERKIPELVNIARENNIEIKSVSLRRPTLDDVFLHFTGRTIREEEASGKEHMRARVAAMRRRK
jgi:ABC-2 type transport system ATP-binding protein